MDINLKNLLLAGIGTVAYTYEKVSGVVDELVKRGELTVSQGRVLNEELKRNMAKADEKCQSRSSDADRLDADMFKEVLAGLNLATRQDIEELKERLARLENQG